MSSRSETVAMVPSPRLFRRVFHLVSPVFLAYYWIPECVSRPDLPLAQCPAAGLTREALLLLVLGAMLCIEIARIALRVPVFGLRPYEAGQVSAFAWGGVGLALGLAFFPPLLVVPAFCGMAWIDPLCAWARKRARHPWLPAVAYALVFAVLLAGMGARDPIVIAGLTAIATPLAILAEHVDVKQVDDDFLMTIVPLVVLAPAYYLLAALL